MENGDITHTASRGPLNALQMLPDFVLCDWLLQSCLRLQRDLKVLALSFMCVQYVQQSCPAPQSPGCVCCGHVQN